MPIDAAVDQMGKQYIHESLPPCFTNCKQFKFFFDVEILFCLLTFTITFCSSETVVLGTINNDDLL